MLINMRVFLLRWTEEHHAASCCARANAAAGHATPTSVTPPVFAIAVHIDDAGVRIEPALAPVRVFQTVECDLALANADRAEAANAARIAQKLALDGEAFLAVVVDDEPRPAFTERGVDVVIPQSERLENVAVGVDNIVCACHCHFLPGIVFPGMVARRPRRGEAAPCKRFDGRQTHDLATGCHGAVGAAGCARDHAAAIARTVSGPARCAGTGAECLHPCGPRWRVGRGHRPPPRARRRARAWDRWMGSPCQ